LDFLAKAREKYLETYERLKKERNIYLIDANKSAEDIFSSVKKILDKEL
jgi:thymidylate kinase